MNVDRVNSTTNECRWLEFFVIHAISPRKHIDWKYQSSLRQLCHCMKGLLLRDPCLHAMGHIVQVVITRTTILVPYQIIATHLLIGISILIYIGLVTLGTLIPSVLTAIRMLIPLYSLGRHRYSFIKLYYSGDIDHILLTWLHYSRGYWPTSTFYYVRKKCHLTLTHCVFWGIVAQS